MITTIQLRDSTKKELLKLKKENQTFEDVIVSLLQEREKYLLFLVVELTKEKVENMQQ